MMTSGPMPSVNSDALPQDTGAYYVVWFDCEGALVDSAWLSRDEFQGMREYLDANRYQYEAHYDKHAKLDSFDKVARVIQEL